MAKYGLIGEKLSHSFSKGIHEQFGYYQYDLLPMSIDELDTFMTEKKFNAVNVTIPYKQTVIPYCDFLDESVQKIGAANTIVNKDGKLTAYNTDYYGFIYSLKINEISLKDKVVMILGTGGTSKTIQAVCESLEVKKVHIVSRTSKNEFIDYDTAIKQKDVEVIINATPSGMYPHNEECPIDIANYPHLEAVVDVIYNPLKTNLILDAEKQAIKTANGLLMLVAQAKFAADKFLDKVLDDNLILPIYQNMLKDYQNIVLIGMPSSGKSTIALALSKIFNKQFVDIDEVIETNAKQSIPEIFSEQGEPYFRSLEHEAVLSTSKQTNLVIATGGGSILNPANVRALKQNGILFYINRDIDQLETRGHRPLSKDKEALKAMYEKRYPLYIQAAHFVIENNQEIESAIDQIKEKFNEIFSH